MESAATDRRLSSNSGSPDGSLTSMAAAAPRRSASRTTARWRASGCQSSAQRGSGGNSRCRTRSHPVYALRRCDGTFQRWAAARATAESHAESAAAAGAVAMTAYPADGSTSGHDCACIAAGIIGSAAMRPNRRMIGERGIRTGRERHATCARRTRRTRERSRGAWSPRPACAPPSPASPRRRGRASHEPRPRALREHAGPDEEQHGGVDRMSPVAIRAGGDQTALGRIRRRVETAASEGDSRPDHEQRRGDLQRDSGGPAREQIVSGIQQQDRGDERQHGDL